MTELKDLIKGVIESTKSNEQKTDKIIELFSMYSRKPMEKIIERLETMQDNLPAELSHCHEFYVEGMFNGLNRAIEIVKEEGGLSV